ncbi:MAG: hypothetical protein EOO17_05925 [Chloroflexi bacterium]|nr:MAG: hypothetical protein EOO17_05925 [Chloroflexota bacterium]
MKYRDDYNPEIPLVMHIDLNSCFATVEQQARPMLRGRPVAIVNRRTEHTMIVTASYEAKAQGVTLGMKLKDAKKICPGLIGIESDPAKYRFVYHKMMDIMSDYSAHVRMKSIDEGVIDFHEATDAMQRRGLIDIGFEIKERLKNEIGCAMRCNVGISTNRFLAKQAASLHKPDGLDVIDCKNLRQIYSNDQILKRLHHLCEATGKKIRSQGKVARGVLVWATTHKEPGAARTQTGRGWEEQRGSRYWHARHMAVAPFFSDQAIYAQAKRLFESAPPLIRTIGVSVYELSDDNDPQLSLFGDELARERHITNAVDEINDRYGKHVIHSADTLGTGHNVKEKIPFGSTRYL